jgi:hypothetical protein
MNWKIINWHQQTWYQLSAYMLSLMTLQKSNNKKSLIPVQITDINLTVGIHSLQETRQQWGFPLKVQL